MLRVEFAKQTRRMRTFIVAAICIVVPFLIALGTRLAGNNNGGGGGGGGGDGSNGLDFVSHQSGLVVGVLSLSFTSVLLIPIVFSIFAGEPVASEAKWGSLRYLLIRPVSRPKVLGAKLLVALSLAVAAVVLIPVVGTISGIAFFGFHPVETLSVAGGQGQPIKLGPVGIVTLSTTTTLLRLLFSTAYVMFATLSVVGVAILVGVVTENTLAAMASGIGLYIVSAILDAISGLSRIHPVLPVHYLEAWTNLFVPGESLPGLTKGVLVAAIWFFVPLLFAFRVFQRKDILS